MKRHNIYLFFALVFLSSCVTEDFFGLSPYGNIKVIEIQHQASAALIDNAAYRVEVELPPGVDLSSVALQQLELSSFAWSDKLVGDSLNLNDTDSIEVVAEDGSIYIWTIVPVIASSQPQLNNGNLNAWYQSSGGYFEPGESASTTIWGTGNPGTQTLGLLATVPFELEADNNAARMETLDNGKLAGTFGAPISAGSIFTGVFNSDNIDPSDPEAAIEFGANFSGRPAQMSFRYSYEPGPENKDKQGNILTESDKCDVYALLEIRSGDETRRLATAWFRSEEIQKEITSMTLDFIYGELDNSYPDYMKPENRLYVSADSALNMNPSHITFVATSSCLGAEFSGAIGSLLLLDDIVMIYPE